MKLNNTEIKEEIKAKYKFFGSGIEDDYDMPEDEFSEDYDEIKENVIGDILNCSISSGITGLQFESIDQPTCFCMVIPCGFYDYNSVV